MRVATSNDGETLQDVRHFDTPEDFDEALSVFSSFEVQSFEKIAGGIAGELDEEKSKLMVSLNIQGWVDVPIKKRFEEHFGCQVYLENDAVLSGLGEACFGAGRNERIVVYLISGTGFGGSRIVDGKLDRDSRGFEPGYQIIDADSTIDPVFLNKESRYGNNLGYLQRFVSGKDLEERFGTKTGQLDDQKIWQEVHRLLAIGINNTIVYWNPDIIVLGGGVLLSDKISVDKLKSELKDILKVHTNFSNIKKAELGDNSALYGALALIKH